MGPRRPTVGSTVATCVRTSTASTWTAPRSAAFSASNDLCSSEKESAHANDVTPTDPAPLAGASHFVDRGRRPRRRPGRRGARRARRCRAGAGAAEDDRGGHVASAAEPRGVRLRDARHRPQLQADPPELVRHVARHEAAFVRGRVLLRQQHLRRRPAEPPRRPNDHADRSGPSEDDLRVRALRHRRGRRADDLPPPPRLRRDRAVRRRPVVESVHGSGRVPELARVPGARRGWCSSATSRFATAFHRREAAVHRSRWSGQGPAAIRASTPIASSSTGSGRGSRCRTSPAPTSSRRVGAMSAPPASSGSIKWDDILDDAFDLSGIGHRLGPQPQFESECRQQGRHPGRSSCSARASRTT